MPFINILVINLKGKQYNFVRMNYIKLAKEYGTPLYVYDGECIRNQYRTLQKAIPYKKLRILYAMKANYNLHILQILKQEGAGIDAVSVGDILMAKKAGFEIKDILFTANKITDTEMYEAQELGVLFNIGSLSRLEKYGAAYPGSDVCIRLNPDVVAGAHEFIKTGGESTKFGILLQDIDEVVRICSIHKLRVVGIHEHTGSGIPETVKMMQGIQNILEVVTKDRFPHLEFMDFGGGFKVAYKPTEDQLNYAKFGDTVTKLFTSFCESYGKDLEMYFEPGKYLVAESGSLIVEVTTLKQNRSKRIAGVNSGFAQLIRPMFYQAYHHITNLSNDNSKEVYDIVGNICESGDCFAVDRPIHKISEGDLLRIHTAGAYCYSMGSRYNLRAMPTELVIDNNQCFVKKRKTNIELIDSIISEY